MKIELDPDQIFKILQQHFEDENKEIRYLVWLTEDDKEFKGVVINYK